MFQTTNQMNFHVNYKLWKKTRSSQQRPEKIYELSIDGSSWGFQLVLFCTQIAVAGLLKNPMNKRMMTWGSSQLNFRWTSVVSTSIHPFNLHIGVCLQSRGKSWKNYWALIIILSSFSDRSHRWIPFFSWSKQLGNWLIIRIWRFP